MKGRIFKPQSFLFLRIAANHISVITLTVFLQFPAFFSGCTPARKGALAHNGRQIYISWAKNPIRDTVDLFFFDTTNVQLLDAYQRAARSDGLSVQGLSRSGAKRLVALSGFPGTAERWYGIRTFGDLRKTSFSLDDEASDAPLLWGEALLEDGATREVSLTMHPLLTHIRLRSVSCDFDTRPYAGQTFFNMHIFLSYAGSECCPLGAGDLPEPVSWLNAGALDSAAVARLPHPEMVLQEGYGEIGPERVYPERDFYCYPASQTCLVLEGRIGKDVCYYPVPLRRLLPGHSYQLDITLLQKGAPDPDMPVTGGTITVESETVPWVLETPQTVYL